MYKRWRQRIGRGSPQGENGTDAPRNQASRDGSVSTVQAEYSGPPRTGQPSPATSFLDVDLEYKRDSATRIRVLPHEAATRSLSNSSDHLNRDDGRSTSVEALPMDSLTILSKFPDDLNDSAVDVTCNTATTREVTSAVGGELVECEVGRSGEGGVQGNSAQIQVTSANPNDDDYELVHVGERPGSTLGKRNSDSEPETLTRPSDDAQDNAVVPTITVAVDSSAYHLVNCEAIQSNCEAMQSTYATVQSRSERVAGQKASICENDKAYDLLYQDKHPKSVNLRNHKPRQNKSLRRSYSFDVPPDFFSLLSKQLRRPGRSRSLSEHQKSPAIFEGHLADLNESPVDGVMADSGSPTTVTKTMEPTYFTLVPEPEDILSSPRRKQSKSKFSLNLLKLSSLKVKKYHKKKQQQTAIYDEPGQCSVANPANSPTTGDAPVYFVLNSDKDCPVTEELDSRDEKHPHRSKSVKQSKSRSLPRFGRKTAASSRDKCKPNYNNDYETVQIPLDQRSSCSYASTVLPDSSLRGVEPRRSGATSSALKIEQVGIKKYRSSPAACRELPKTPTPNVYDIIDRGIARQSPQTSDTRPSIKKTSSAGYDCLLCPPTSSSQPAPGTPPRRGSAPAKGSRRRDTEQLYDLLNLNEIERPRSGPDKPKPALQPKPTLTRGPVGIATHVDDRIQQTPDLGQLTTRHGSLGATSEYKPLARYVLRTKSMSKFRRVSSEVSPTEPILSNKPNVDRVKPEIAAQKPNIKRTTTSKKLVLNCDGFPDEVGDSSPTQPTDPMYFTLQATPESESESE